MSDKPELPEMSAVRVWAKNGKFSRGIYEPPTKEVREIWEFDGDREEPLYTAAQMLAIRDQGIKYGMELAAQIVENVTSEVWHDGNYAVADAIRSKAVQNTVQVSGKEGV
jgi:hypothetical protein